MYVRGDYSIRPKSTASNEEKRGQKKETKIKSRSKQLIIIVSQFIYVIPHTPGPHMPKIIGQKKNPTEYYITYYYYYLRVCRKVYVDTLS